MAHCDDRSRQIDSGKKVVSVSFYPPNLEVWWNLWVCSALNGDENDDNDEEKEHHHQKIYDVRAILMAISEHEHEFHCGKWIWIRPLFLAISINYGRLLEYLICLQYWSERNSPSQDHASYNCIVQVCVWNIVLTQLVHTQSHARTQADRQKRIMPFTRLHCL